MQSTRPLPRVPARPPGRPGGRPPRRRPSGMAWLNLLAVVLVGTGVIIAFIGHDTLRWAPPPVPPAWAAGHPAHPPQYRYRGRPGVLAPSVPVSIAIPAIKVRAAVTDLGLRPDGSISVPSLHTPFLAGWYDRGRPRARPAPRSSSATWTPPGWGRRSSTTWATSGPATGYTYG